MKIGFFADGPWSHQAIYKILEDTSQEIRFICARYENPDSVLKKIAEERQITFFSNPNINSDEFLEIITPFLCDLLVSMSFNQIFKKRIINLTPKKIINCHAGKLPFYRGKNVLNWALINDEKEFGITVHYVDEGIDTGDILLQKNYKISDQDNYATLLERAYKECPKLLYLGIKNIQDGTVERIKQNTLHPLGFYCSGREDGDEKLYWNQNSRKIFNFVRAICLPGPQARSFLNGTEIYINKIDIVSDAPTYIGIPGSVLMIEGNSLIVKTLDSFVRVSEWSENVKIRVGDRLE